MGRIKETAGRPKKWGDEPKKLMMIPVRLEKAINEFIQGVLKNEKADRRPD